MGLVVMEATRKKPKTGDVFVIQPIQGRFLYGHVIKTNIENDDPMIKGWSLIFIYGKVTSDPVLPESFRSNEFILPPMIVNNQGWLKGYFKTIGNIPVSNNELEKSYGFWDILTKGYVNEEGVPLINVPEIYGDYGLSSYGAVSYGIDKLLTINPNLLDISSKD